MEKYEVRNQVYTEIKFNNKTDTFIIFRGDIRIEIKNGLIKLTCHDRGDLIDLRSQQIKKQALRNMFIGIKGDADNQTGAMIIDLYKRVN